MSSLLEINDVAVDAGKLNIIAGVTLILQRGQTLGLVGESGSGKTTLARAILGLTPISRGTIVFEGRALNSPQAFQASRGAMAMMFQDAGASLSPRLRVGTLVTEPLIIHDKKPADLRAKAAELLDLVGLNAALVNRFPHELSGGQARRVGVARALAMNPSLIVADEPTAGLDVSVQGEILNLLNDLKRKKNIAYLLITHNLALVRHVADHVAVMYLGRLVETGPTRRVFEKPLHPYTQSLLAAEPKPDPRKRRAHLQIQGEIPSLHSRPKGCEFHTRCPMAQYRCKTESPELRGAGQGQTVRCHFFVQ